MSILSKFGLFTMPAHQIWLCHVTQMQISKIFYFVLILHLILGKVTHLNLKWKSSLRQKLSAKNFTGGGKHPPPSAFRVKYETYWETIGLCSLVLSYIDFC